jgi:hypothetical protein
VAPGSGALLHTSTPPTHASSWLKADQPRPANSRLQWPRRRRPLRAATPIHQRGAVLMEAAAVVGATQPLGFRAGRRGRQDESRRHRRSASRRSDPALLRQRRRPPSGTDFRLTAGR